MRKKKKIFGYSTLFLFLLGISVYFFTRDLETYFITEEIALPIKESIPEGLISLKAKDCGVCHKEIYEEWKTTVHARAWTDDYFQIDWYFDKKKQNCLNCHTPFQNQQEQLVLGFNNDDPWDPILRENPDFDAEFQKEGVTCVSCHVKEGQIIGPFGTTGAPHPVKVSPEMTSGWQICSRCHVIKGSFSFSMGTLNICTTITDIEANNIEPDCIGCHMPETFRPLVEGFPKRKGRKHLWRGGHSPEMVIQALQVEIREKSKEGNRFEYEIKTTNVGTHHRLPTGTPDRHILLRVSLLDKNKRVLKSKDEKLIRRILWRPFPFEWSDTRLEFQKPRVFHFDFIVNDDDPYTLKVTADYFFLEQWRREQVELPNDSHRNYRIFEKEIQVR